MELVRIRNPLASLLVALMALFWLGFPVLILCVVLSDVIGRDPALAAAAVIAGLLALRGFRIGVELTPSHVLIRNYFRSRALPWSEIAAVVASRQVTPGMGETVGCAAFITKAGQRHKASATMSWGWAGGKPSKHAERIAAMLRACAEEHGVEARLRPPDLM